MDIILLPRLSRLSFKLKMHVFILSNYSFLFYHVGKKHCQRLDDFPTFTMPVMTAYPSIEVAAKRTDRVMSLHLCGKSTSTLAFEGFSVNEATNLA